MFSEQRIYPNGLKLIVNQTDNQLACVLVRIETGVANELKKHEGITSVVENILLCGTEKYPSKNSLKSAVESFGGKLYTVAELDSIRIYIECLPQHVDEAVEVISQIVFKPIMNVADLQGIKDAINEFRKTQMESPFLLAYDNLREIMFAGSGLEKNILGRKRSVELLDFETIKQFWNDVLSPYNMIISVSGNVEVDDVYGVVMEQFYGKLLEFSGKRTKDIESIKKDHTVRFILDTKKIFQNRILIGYRTEGFSSKSFYALYLMRQIIDAKLKEKFDKVESVFSVGCYLNSFMNNGIFYIRTAVDDIGAQDILRNISSSIYGLVSNGVSNAEFISFKEMFKTKFVQSVESSASLSKTSSKYTRYLGYAFDIVHELELIDNLTQGDCLKAMRKLLNDKPYMSIVGSSKFDEKMYYEFYNKIKKIV